MKSFLQHLQEEEEDDKQTFTTTRGEIMQRRGMGGTQYLDALKKFRQDPKNAELLKPFALPSVDPVDLNRPIQVQYGAPGVFGPRDRQEFNEIKDTYGFVAGGFAVRPGDPLGRPTGIRINSEDIPSGVVGEFKPTESKKPALTKKDGKFVVTMKSENNPPVVKTSSGHVYDVVGHEAAHTTQYPKSHERPRVVPPLPGDTPENKEFRDYLFNTDEPAARANEYKAYLISRGLNVKADMSSDDYKFAMELLKPRSINDQELQADLEFYNTPQGEALFRGAKAKLPDTDPTKNKPINPGTTATALAEHWSRMAKNYK